MNAEFKKIFDKKCEEFYGLASYDSILIATSNLMVAKQLKKQNKTAKKMLKIQEKFFQKDEI